VGSPAYADNGLLIITFDEASNDASDCCGEPMSPNTASNGGSGNGGGRIGAVLLSRYIKPGSVNDTPYNHYSLLRSTEDLFGLSHLAFAANAGLKPFEADVFNEPDPDHNGPKPKVTLKHVPAKCVSRPFTAQVRVTSNRLRDVRVYVDGKRITTRKGRKFSVKVKTKKLKRGKHRLKAEARDKIGRKGSKTVKFRVC
jgi:phosphatidylinositol-3-phosphatase